MHGTSSSRWPLHPRSEDRTGVKGVSEGESKSLSERWIGFGEAAASSRTETGSGQHVHLSVVEATGVTTVPFSARATMGAYKIEETVHRHGVERGRKQSVGTAFQRVSATVGGRSPV